MISSDDIEAFSNPKLLILGYGRRCCLYTYYGIRSTAMSTERKSTNEKLRKEAASVGLELIGSGRDCTYRLYKFFDCGHEVELKTSNVRLAKKKYTCSVCTSEKLRKEARAAGLTLIGDGKTSYFKTYKFNSCGHEQEIGTPEVRRGKFACQSCLKEKHEAEAKAAGLILVGKLDGPTKNRRVYRFKDCGHEKTIRISDVRKGRFTCRVCNPKASFDKEAEREGLQLIGSGRNAHYRKYRFVDCGHEQEIAISAVRSGFFKCFECGSTAHSQPSNLYVNVVELDGYSTVKVGIAKNVDLRISGYKLQSRCKITTALIIPFETGQAARVAEFAVKREFSDFRDPMSKEIMKTNGYTECFLSEKLDEIVRFCLNLKPEVV